MPVPKKDREKYAKIVGHMINSGKSQEEAKDIADAAIKPGHQRTGKGRKRGK